MKKLFKKINIYSQKGIAIVELLLYMGILSILLTTLTSIFISALDVQSESSATSSVEQDGNYILARFAYDIHRAENVDSVSLPLGSTGDNFTIVIDGVNYTYAVNGDNNLTLTNDLGENNLNNYNSSISAFMIQHLGNVGGVEDSLKITFTVSSREKRISGIETEDFGTNLSLRRQ